MTHMLSPSFARICRELGGILDETRRPVLQSELTAALLDVLLATPDLGGEWHPVGFMKLTLQEEAGRVLRLHVWPPAARSLPQGITAMHDHIFRMRSLVLAGSVTNHTLSVLPSTRGAHQVWRVSYCSGENLLLPTGIRVDAIADASTKVHSGELYEVPSREFHCTESSCQLGAATLVLTFPTSSRAPRVLGRLGSRPIAMRRTPCMDGEFRAALAMVAESGRPAAAAAVALGPGVTSGRPDREP
jgi:hypothetical protein